MPPTPWGANCARCKAPRVSLPTGHGSSAAVLYAAGMVSAPRIVLACLHCDFGSGRADAGPPRFMTYMRRGGA